MDDEKVLYEILKRKYEQYRKEYKEYTEEELYQIIYDDVRSLLLCTD